MTSDEEATCDKEYMHADPSQLPTETQYTDAEEIECMIYFL
jgi:hypothetical protein